MQFNCFETISDTIEICIYDKTEERGEVADIHIQSSKNVHLYIFRVGEG